MRMLILRDWFVGETIQTNPVKRKKWIWVMKKVMMPREWLSAIRNYTNRLRWSTGWTILEVRTGTCHRRLGTNQEGKCLTWHRRRMRKTCRFRTSRRNEKISLNWRVISMVRLKKSALGTRNQTKYSHQPLSSCNVSPNGNSFLTNSGKKATFP